MKVTHIDHGEWEEKRFEPDAPPAADNAKTNGRAAGTSTTTIGVWPKLDPIAYYGLAGEVVNTAEGAGVSA